MVISIEQNMNHTYQGGGNCVWTCQRREMRMHACLHIRRNLHKKEHVWEQRFEWKGQRMYWNMYVYLDASISVREVGGKFLKNS